MEKRLPLPAGTVLQGRYRILRSLGHGGFGAVYEAVDDELGLSFALKETFYAFDDDLRQAFRREARMLASLTHEAFPRVTHYFTEGDGCFLVMENIPGDDLDKLLTRRGAPFDTEEVLDWADQLLDALEDLHQGGIVHRDIKPSNLKLTPKGKIKLLDFGIAKGALEGDTTILTTVGSLAAATLQYAPLEQVLKASPQYQMMLSVINSDLVARIVDQGTNPASDLFALGATLYQLLTKQLPTDAPTRALAIWSGQSDRLPAPNLVNPRLPAAVSDALLIAMRLDRDTRFQSAAAMRRALRSAAENPVPFVPAPTEPAVQRETVTVLKPLAAPEIETVEKNARPFAGKFDTPEGGLEKRFEIPIKTGRDWFIVGGFSFVFLMILYLVVYNVQSNRTNSYSPPVRSVTPSRTAMPTTPAR
ncbi:MAG: serine/threonine protein kinase [Acidobacteria bacterium]|nr:serine/threonine protein kinase [Acidobacteriota bacterium]